MIRVFYKQYYRCDTQLAQVTGIFGSEVKILVNSVTFNGVLNDDGTYSSAPAWFADFSFFPLGDFGWVFTPPAETNTTYRFSWTLGLKSGIDVEFIVQLNMIEQCSVDVNVNVCNPDGVRVLAWLTREGGWAYFTFNGKRTYSVTNPEANNYKTPDHVLYSYKRDGVYDAELVTTGDIPESSLDLIDSLRTSIQAYVIDKYNTLEERYLPIIVQDGDFIKRKTGDKIFDVSVNFIYATEKLIQGG